MGIVRYAGRVALVTGASSGIGAAIVQELQRQGLVVVGMARRVDKIKALSVAGAPGKLHAIKGDVRNENEILEAFKWIKKNLGGVDVLVNNAGIFRDGSLSVAPTSEWKDLFDVNVLGLSICTREAVKDMRERGVDDGYIIHIGSFAGHVLPMMSNVSMYHATKHAVRALTEGLRKDLVASKSNIRNTTISPGFVKSEILNNCTTFKSDEMYSVTPHMESEDIAAVVSFVLSQPLRVQIHDMIINPTGANY